MPYFFASITPYRADFLTREVEEENKMMSEHFLYLKKLLSENKLFLAGPALLEKGPKGICIFETETEEEARSLLDADPSIRAGIQIIQEFGPIRLSLHR